MIVGLTGPMGSGKNIVADFFAQEGWHVIDADKKAYLALDILKNQIVAAFSEEARQKKLSLLTDDNSLNRKNLAKIVFSHKNLLRRHENLVYPMIDRILSDELDLHKEKPIVINAAMLYKSALIKKCSCLIYVDAPVVLRLLRCKKRDNSSFLQIFKVFFQQKHLLAQYLKLNADIYTVRNIGSVSSLKDKIQPIISKICNV
ncbi:MAG: dephospho-CoA kinase [Treponemataceae bacterium]